MGGRMNDASQDDAGFGIVEIIVSMLMLAILAMVLAPVIISGVRATAKMSTIATATQLVNDGLETQRATIGTSGCPATAPAPTTTTDARGVELTREILFPNLSACSATGLLDVTVRVTTVKQTPLFPAGKVLSSADTKVYVS